MLRIALSALALLFSLYSFSQTTTIVGQVVDSISKQGLSFATVSLVSLSDSVLVTFSMADSSGYFFFAGIQKDVYLLSASYAGYKPTWIPVSVRNDGPVQQQGTLVMTSISNLDQVTVTEKRPPVSIVNDTLEFNSENFKTQPNAVVEDMLRKMPGISVETDGTIKVNGQTVRRVLVNGKEFFTGDPKMATKNLSADALDKVQVFDRKSDQSLFTGVDDGNTEKTINLKSKKDRANAVFGRATASAGLPQKFDAQANVNKFNTNEQLSVLGMGNNTNRQGFSLEDAMNFSGEASRGMRNGGGIMIRNNDEEDQGLPVTGLGQNQQGVAKTFAGGVNYNLKKKGSDFNGSYTASNINLVTDKQSLTQSLLPASTLYQAENSLGVKNVSQHRFGFSLDQQVDSFTSFKITPALILQNNRLSLDNTFTTLIKENMKLNDGISGLVSSARALNFTSGMLLRRKLAKRGRTISANLNLAYNRSSSAATQQAAYAFYDTLQASQDSTINQQNQRHVTTKSIGGNLIYTEPAGTRSLVELNGYYNISLGESNRTSFDFNKTNNRYDNLNSRLSNHFSSRYEYAGGGGRWRSKTEKAIFSIGAQLQRAILTGSNFSHQTAVTRGFTDLLPNLIYQYQFSRLKSFRLSYNTSVTQPSVMQLQPVADISNPLNITTGNPNLKRQYNHNISLNYFGVSIARKENLLVLFNANINENAITTAGDIKMNGSRVTTPVNSKGMFDIFGNINYGFPLGKLKSRMELESSVLYNHNITYLNSQKSLNQFFSLGPRVTYHLDVDTVTSLQFVARLSYNQALYTLQPRFNNRYFQQTYSIDLTNNFRSNFTLNNQISYVINTGRAPGFNNRVPLWNLSLAKNFMKNKRAEVKFTLYDALNKNVGFSRDVNDNRVVDQAYNVLNRYFLLGFTYSLNKSGLNRGPGPVLRRIGG